MSEIATLPGRKKGLIVMTATGLVGLVFGPILPVNFFLCMAADMVIGLVIGILALRYFEKHIERDRRTSGGPALFGIIAGIFLALALSFFLHGASGMVFGGEVTAPVADAPVHSGAAIFHLRDARVLPARIHGLSITVGKYGAVGHYYARPLLPVKWRIGDEVPAWAVCNEDYCYEHYYPQGIRPLLPTNLIEYESAVHDAEKQYQLHSAINAPMIELVENPYEALMWIWIRAAIVSGLIYLVWLIATEVMAG